MDPICCLLWDAPHGTMSNFIPGKLSLCLDLPIMIWVNAATELCITKGQKGTVYSWLARVGSHGQQVLDTLFVKLSNPLQNIKLDHLPENVVPLVSNSNNVECHLHDDTYIHLSRIGNTRVYPRVPNLSTIPLPTKPTPFRGPTPVGTGKNCGV